MARLGEANVGGRLVPAWLLDLTAEELDGLKWHSNPNLLDNWYFGNPVNQRGQTEYSGDSYCIDRWFAGDNKVTLEDDGILVTCNVALSIFRQYLEFAKLLSGKVITFSVDAEIISGRWFLTDMSYFSAAHNDQPINNGITSYSFRVSDPSAQGSSPAVGMFSPSKGSQIKVHSIKMELGTQQTLAHQDAYGNWVLNEIPDYGEQLRRCQRYQLVLSKISGYAIFGTGLLNSDATVRVFVPTPVTLRTTPAVSCSGSLEVLNGISVFSVKQVRVDSAAQNGVSLLITIGSGASIGQPAMLRSASADPATLIFDANL